VSRTKIDAKKKLLAAILRAIALGGLIGLNIACGDVVVDGDLELRQNLMSMIDSSTPAAETRVIDFGSPSSRPLMLDGWSPDQITREEDQTTITWTTGPTAAVRFFVPHPSDTMVRLTCAPVATPSDQPKILELLINDQPWTEIELRPGFRDYRLYLPKRLVAQRWNKLTLRPLWGGDPESCGSRFTHRMAWDRIVFGEPREQPTPSFDEAHRTLLLPPDTEIAYHLDLSPNSWLAIASTGTQRDGAGKIKVTWDTGVDSEKIIDTVRLQADPSRIQLTADDPAIGSLALAPAGLSASIREIGELAIVGPASAHHGPQEPTTGISDSVSEERSGGPNPSTANVIVYLIDTLRADHMGCYGYSRPTTPQIDEFASQAILFENSQAQSPWTRASIASIFTGLWPETHGAQDREQKLPEEVETLAEILTRHSYDCFGVTANGNSHAPWGFGQGFIELRYLEGPKQSKKLARSDDLNHAALEWLDNRESSRPFFLWIQTVDPHAPYEAPEPFWSTFAPDVTDPGAGSVERLLELTRHPEAVTQTDINRMVNLYDAEVAANDAAFGELVKQLRARNLYDETLIVVLADHGEEFFDHGGWTHGKSLYAEMLDVPLIIKPPRHTGGQRRSDLAQHIDILPTVLDYAGLETPPALPGRSLRPHAQEPPPGFPQSVAIAQMRLDGRVGSSMTDNHWKVVVREYEGFDAFPRLYDRTRDRTDSRNLAEVDQIRAQLLATRMRQLESRGIRLHDRELLDLEANPEIEEQLRALGYIE